MHLVAACRIGLSLKACRTKDALVLVIAAIYSGITPLRLVPLNKAERVPCVETMLSYC